MNAAKIRVAYFDDERDNIPKPIDATWAELCEWFDARERRPSKSGPAWSPADYGDDVSPRRDNDRVRSVTLATFDLDHLADAELDRITASLEGRAYALHSTHSHSPPANGSYRLVMPLSAPVPAAAWRSVLAAALDVLGVPADPACKDLSRLYFLPSAPAGAPVVAKVGQGAPLDVAALLEHARSLGAAPRPLQPPAPVNANAPPQLARVELEPLRKAVEGRRQTYARNSRPGDQVRAEVLGRVLAGTQLAGEGERDNTVNKAATLIAIAVPLETPADAALELLRSSLSAMPLEPEGLDHWIDRARYSYERAIERRRADEAERDAKAKASQSALLASFDARTRRDAADLPAAPAEPDADPAPAPVFSLTDLGNAERFAHDHARDVRHADELGWLVWDGKRWAPDKTRAVERRAAGTVRGILRAAHDEQDREKSAALARHAVASESDGRMTAMVKRARSCAGIATPVEAFDRSPWLFNVGNGTIDLRSGEAHEHRREDLITKLGAAVDYDSASPCPTWLKFLEQVLPSKEMRSFVQRAVGYSLTGETTEHALFVLHGNGANGKSVFLETVRALLGDYSRVAAASVLMERRDGTSADETAVAHLYGARFVSVSETEAGRKLAAAMIKNVTGADRVSARELYKARFEFKPEFKLWLATNHKPVIDDNSDGIWRRLKVITFGVTIAKEDQDPELSSKLRAELSGILAWAVAGALEWRRSGLQEPKEVDAAVREYRAAEDPLGEFVEDRCVLKPELEATTEELLRAYQQWCGGGLRSRALSPETFARALKRDGIEPAKRVGSSKKRGWRGIGLAGVGGAT